MRCNSTSASRTPLNQSARASMDQVSAEVAPLSVALAHTPKVVEKSDAARARIRAVIQRSFLLGGSTAYTTEAKVVVTLYCVNSDLDDGRIAAVNDAAAQPHVP